jgi:hypothetical protein
MMNDIAKEAQLLDKPGGAQLRLRFRGPFEGGEVTWDALLITLEAWQREHPDSPVLQNFIDIGDETAEGIALTVGLQVDRIDLPAVRKTMMMIRQYKRLRPGCHLYGPRLG